MKKVYELIEDLPPLAWYAKIEDGVITILHGKNVECKDGFFVEGAWNGEFCEGNFAESNWFTGTGGRFSNDEVVFSTPTHITFPLFSMDNGKGCCISNSLHFLMVMNSLSLDIQYLNYEVDFNTVCKGINGYKNYIEVVSKDGKKKISIHFYRNLIVSNDTLLSQIKTVQYAFDSFQDYEKQLLAAMEGMIKNAQDAARNAKYGIATMISTGYDSPCAATIAKKLGCDLALTFSAKGKYVEDNGKEIAEKIGYSTIIEKDADSYRNRKDLIEAQYIASGELGVEISFSAFEDEYRRRLIFTGEGGDYIWDKDCTYTNNEIHAVKFTSGLSNIERRLWGDYVPVPMPLFGATAWPSIHTISNSIEMKPWVIESGYDRPIPRRIVESAGVSRESFGTIKRGAGFTYHFDWYRRAMKRMSDTSAQSLQGFVKKNNKQHPLQVIRYILKTLPIYTNRAGITKMNIDIEEMSMYANPTRVRYMFPWACKIVEDKYKRILQEIEAL